MRLRLRTDRLAALLAASRLSQNHWAIRLGLSRGHWSDIVNGRHPYPSAKTRQRMLEVFDVAERELFAAVEGHADDVEFRLALASKYEIATEIGQGAMGSVFLATDRPLGRLVAIKVVSPEAAAGVGSRALLTEIAFVARLQHPNILPLFEAGEAAAHPYYVMPYVRDGSIRTLLQRRGRIGVGETLELVHGMARGLAHAHEQQVLHCDVKPENVLVQDGHCFVMDFGIARKLRSEAGEWRGIRKELDFSAGTPAYVSPEQARGTNEVDQRSDVYSLACVVYEMLSGQAPFGGRTTQEVVTRRFHEAPPPLASLAPDVPEGLVRALEQAMSVEPSERPASTLELSQALRDGLRPVVRVPGGAPPRKTRNAPTRSRLPMTGLRSDVRYAVRSLLRGWRFALGVVLTLALGIGLGVPVLNLADHFFFRAPPGVVEPDRVLRLILRGNRDNGPYFTDGLTGLDYSVMTARAKTLAGVAGFLTLQRSLGTGPGARAITVTVASASYFPVLGVRPFMGRFFLASEDTEGIADPPCVISHRFWQTAMDGTKDVLGRKLVIGALRYTVVGVTPEGFTGLNFGTMDAWLPLHVATPEFQGRDPLIWTTDQSSWLRIIVRLKPGVSLAQATAEATLLYRTAGSRTRDRELTGTFLWDPLQPGRSSLGNRFATISLWLSAGSLMLLLLVAANLINLFVARSAAHARQTAVRLAVGGNWRHLLRLQLIEAAVLAVAASVVGLAIAVPTVRVSRTLMFPDITWARPAFDVRIALIAFVIAFGIGALVAVWSTVSALRADPLDLLRGAGSPQMSGSQRTNALRRTLLVVQAAVFAILLTGASAFVISLRRASRVDLGFDHSAVVSARIGLPAATPRDVARDLMMRAHQRVASLPGIESASLAYMEPFVNNAYQPVHVPGSSVASPPSVMFDMATPDYPRTFGVRMREGRWFNDLDGPNAAPVVVINESLAKLFWPAGGAVGQCMRVGADSMPCRTIVGVVRDFQVTGRPDDPVPPIDYVPVAQAGEYRQRPMLFFRPKGDRATAIRVVRETLQALTANLPASEVRPLTDHLQWMTAPLLIGAAAFTAFGVVAAIVGAVGLYSVLAFLILEQRRAYAIRLAIGAGPASLARSVVRFAVGTVVAGMALGYALLVPLARVLEPMLFHTRTLDPVAMVGVGALGVATALLAALFPVRSVLKTDVMAVLREQ